MDPKHQLDIVERTVEWFDKYLKPELSLGIPVRATRDLRARRNVTSSPIARDDGARDVYGCSRPASSRAAPSSSPAAARASGSRWRRRSRRYGASVTIAGRRRDRLDAAVPEIAAAARDGGDGRDLRRRRARARPRARSSSPHAVGALRQGRRPRQQRRGQLPRPLRQAHAQRFRRRRAHRPLRLRALHARRRTPPARAQGARERSSRSWRRYVWSGSAYVLPVGVREGGRPRHDAVARRRVGPRRHPAQRDRAGADPDRGRVLAAPGRDRRRRRTPSAGSRSAASATRRRSRTSRRSCSRTSARTRPATASRWTAASGSPARESSRTTGGSAARALEKAFDATVRRETEDA